MTSGVNVGDFPPGNFICLSVCVSVCLSCLRVCLVCLSVLSACLSCLPACLSCLSGLSGLCVCLSVRPSVHLSVCLCLSHLLVVFLTDMVCCVVVLRNLFCEVALKSSENNATSVSILGQVLTMDALLWKDARSACQQLFMKQ